MVHALVNDDFLPPQAIEVTPETTSVTIGASYTFDVAGGTAASVSSDNENVIAAIESGYIVATVDSDATTDDTATLIWLTFVKRKNLSHPLLNFFLRGYLSSSTLSETGSEVTTVDHSDMRGLVTA